MKQFFTTILMAVVLVMSTLSVNAQQLPDPHFEDWSGAQFSGNIQPKHWHGSNVEQLSFKFNFTTRETGRSGYCVKVANTYCGAMGIGQVSPGYVTLGNPWQYINGMDKANATGGTDGGIDFTYRPDSMYVWIKRTGNKATSENFSLLFYSWKGNSVGSAYKANENNNCTSTGNHTNEESDIRQALDANKCGTSTKATQIAEGFMFDKKAYSSWTQIKVPIYYFNDEVPQKCNVILSSSGYPNFRESDNINENNAICADDIELIYSAKIQQLYIGGKQWKGFDPNSSAEQVYSVGRTTVMPEIYAVRGAGSITNIRGTVVNFPGRRLSDSEISIQPGQIDGAATVITVTSGDGLSTMTYRIKFVQDKSDNATLSSILVNGAPINNFNPQLGTYNVALPYGTTATPVVSVEKAEDSQTVVVNQATSPTGTATVNVTAENGVATKTYTINFSIAPLADNTLAGIKVNGKALPGFVPTLLTYTVELPLGTATMPTVEAVSAYPAGEQTIRYEAPETIDGGQYKIYVTTPGNQTPKVYKLKLKITASTYSKLADLQMGNYIEDFDPNTTTYYVSLPKGTTQLPQITYVKGDENQTVQVEEGGVNGTTTITVIPASGDKDKTVYRIICSIAKSDVSYLNGIFLDGQLISGFNKNNFKYTVNLPTGTTTLPAITYEQGDPTETVDVTVGGINATTYLFVTAENGSTSLYEIYFQATFADVSTLDMITVAGTPVAGFDPNTTEYSIALPQGTTTLPEIGFTKHDAWQNVTVRSNGLNGDTKITVRSQAGTQTIYVLHFSVTTSTNTTLAWVKFDGVLYEDFDPAVSEYDITLGEGVSQVPAVSFEKAEASQKVVGTLEGTTYTIRVIAESGAQNQYIFRFAIQKSENAFLNNIYLDGNALVGFDKEEFVYDVVLTTATCPVITVNKDPSQHVMITAPASTGTARIVVTPESGAPNTYIINFTSDVQPQLTQIYANYVPVEGFTPSKLEYEVSYSGKLPIITFEKADESIKTSLVTDASHARIYVQAGGVEKIYTLTFVPVYSADASLTALAANGEPVADFASDKLSYTMALPANGEIPVITYECAEKAHVVAGQSGRYGYSLQVIAESGATQTYTIAFTTGASDTTTLKSVTLGGNPITFDENNTYTQDIETGKALPELAYKKRDEQTVISAQTAADQQQIIVVAENGDTETYTINYNETQVINALLKGINVQSGEGWKALESFDENTVVYNITLPLGTAVAPCVWPIAAMPGQVITVTYGAANGATTIHVKASNDDEKTYTLNFATLKSSNTKLESLTIDDTDYSVDETSIKIQVPFGTTEPYTIEYKKAEASQLVEFKSAPITEKSEIIVTAENGDKRTYTVEYEFPELEGENILKEIRYEYVNASDEVISGRIVPTKQEEIIDLPFGAKSFTVTGYDKNYPEQSVVFFNGGIRRGATLIVSANHDNLEDVTYTLTPRLPEFDTTGKLKDLKFKGTTVPNFKPYVYNYMVNVTAQPAANDFTYTTYNGETVTPSSIDGTKKQITFTVAGGETYSVCWFYEHDGMYQEDGSWYSYLDFSAERWKKATKNGYKPYKWNVPGDYADKKDYVINLGITKISFTYSTGKEVMMGGESGALLSTMRGASLNGSVPGMMCLNANMSVSLETSGNSTFRMQGTASTGVQFRNTPEQFALDYNPLSVSGDINHWTWQLLMSNGTTAESTDYEGTFSPLNTKNTAVKDINYGSIGAVSKYTLLIKAADKPTPSSSAVKCYNGGTISESSLIVQNLRFIYNSELTAVKVDGNTTTLSADTFKYNLGDGVMLGKPSLKFTGKVHDQMQVIRWENDGEWIKGELVARVTNFGENSQDSTVYFVKVMRNPVTTLAYTRNAFQRGGVTYTTTTSNDTVYVNLPFGTKALPDLDITPASIHQLVKISKKAREIKVTVTNENKVGQDTVYVFREMKASAPELASLSAVNATLTPTFSPEVTEYSVSAVEMPVIQFTKPRSAEAYGLSEELDLGQTAVLKYTANSATVKVTTADKASKTYTVTLNKLAPTPNGSLTAITRNGEILSGFKSDTRAYEAAKSENVGFVRKQQTDSIVQTLTDANVSIKVQGEAEPYIITYPTEPSSNVKLKDILIDSVHYDKFNPDRESYDYESNEPVDVKFILSEEVQKMEITVNNGSNAPSRKTVARSFVTVFNVKITAENGDTKTYTFTIRPESSSVNTLAGISVAGEPLDNFSPERTNYTYVIPSATPKLAEPQIPSVSYTLGQENQTIEIQPATKTGETTSIFVTPEDGSEAREYKITFTTTPSNNAELKNILINGDSISSFKPSRTFYSMQVLGVTVDVDWTTGDPFQTVQKQISESNDELIVTLIVTAQDGTQRVYEIEIWTAAKSANANLADILLNGKSMVDYAAERGIEGLIFNEKTYSYTIPLSLNDTMPDISASLQEDAQTIEVLTESTAKGTVKKLHVTAEDQIESNDYELLFYREKSSNTNLAMILIQGDSLKGFDENVHDYIINLPIGDKTIPSVDAYKGEAVQVLAMGLPVTLSDGKRTELIVTAEDGSTATYTVTFKYTYSTVDTLKGIYVGEDLIEGFRADSVYYSYVLPMGVRTIPIPDFEPGDNFQQPQRIDTIVSQYRTTYQCLVTAHDGIHTRVYTVVYEIQPSNIDTLRSIYVNTGSGKRPLDGFAADILTYTCVLPKDAPTPVVEAQKGDQYQEVDTAFIGNIYTIKVTAENGRSRTYTIIFERERSNDATLTAILYGGKAVDLQNEKFDYTIELPYGTTELPLVTYEQKEGQQVAVTVSADTVYIAVTAEDGVTKSTYTLAFEQGKSDNAYLASITIGGEQLADFKQEKFDYTILLPYGTTELPEVTAELADSTATMTQETDGKVVTITTTAADEVNGYDYYITFTIDGCPINWLNDLTVKGTTIEGFHKDTLLYTIAYPVGTDSTSFIHPEDINYVLGDSTETVDVSEDKATIYINVVAENGEVRVYAIMQVIKFSSNCLLSDLLLGGQTIKDFDPETFTYTYILLEGEVKPDVEAVAADSLAEVSITPGTDEVKVYCTAQDGSEQVYTIVFETSKLNTAEDASSTDVLLKQIAGTETFAAYSIRVNTWVAIYDDKGNMYLNVEVPVCNPNDASISYDARGKEILTDANGDAAYFTLPAHGQTIFYVFYSGKQRILSGKFMVQ